MWEREGPELLTSKEYAQMLQLKLPPSGPSPPRENSQSFDVNFPRHWNRVRRFSPTLPRNHYAWLINKLVQGRILIQLDDKRIVSLKRNVTWKSFHGERKTIARIVRIFSGFSMAGPSSERESRKTIFETFLERRLRNVGVTFWSSLL